VAAVKFTICSENPHKLDELQPLLPGFALELLAGADFPVEDGATYTENARIKARYGRLVGAADSWMLADDSGIEVAALGEGPGVRTARWANGRHVERILEALAGAGDRRARYVCELVALSPEGEEHRGTGVLHGSIATKPAGTGGFGFDPVFVPDGETRTVAELGDEWKAEHSHRALAARSLLAGLETEPGSICEPDS
jgi:XTP/dITP diphosphohydrolase